MDAVTSVAWAPNLMLLASGSRDRSIRIHNTSSSQQLQLIKDALSDAMLFDYLMQLLAGTHSDAAEALREAPTLASADL